MLPRTDAGRVRPKARSARVTSPIGPIAVAGNHPLAAPCPASVPSVRADAGCDALLAGASAQLERARCLGSEAALAASEARAASDVEGVMLATRKADAAFRMLEAARNAMLEAYARMGEIR
jgi:flagellar hook-basal body complex protein FliE